MNFPWLHFSGDAVADRAIGVRSAEPKVDSKETIFVLVIEWGFTKVLWVYDGL